MFSYGKWIVLIMAENDPLLNAISGDAYSALDRNTNTVSLYFIDFTNLHVSSPKFKNF